MTNVEIAPSILAANFARLWEEIAQVEPYSKRLHVDVMDGHFVPNLSMGPAVVEAIRPLTSLPIEVHLMVTEPLKFAAAFKAAGADRLIFHAEVVEDPVEAADQIRALEVSPGIAVNPETDLHAAEALLGAVDLVLVMTVNPGFGGQEFLESSLPKVSRLRNAVTVGGFDVDIEVDGGVDPRTAPRAKEAGANVFVAGSAIFGAEDPALAAKELAEIVSMDA